MSIKNLIRNLLLLGATGIVAAAFVLEGYSFFIQQEGRSPLPETFGNFETTRGLLENQPQKNEFAFAVVGDTKSRGTFERITERLRNEPLDFAVLLGDCTFDETETAHRYFRAELDEYAQSFPVFYIVGNHDVDPVGFPVERFEQDYGPSIFSFEYQKCLFIALRILDSRFSNAESLRFLRTLNSRTAAANYNHIFVFMHIPPAVSSDFIARPIKENDELVTLLQELGVDYVFAGDYHGYARTKKEGVTYIVTGGGGSRLREIKEKQFHHALVMRVRENFISEKFIPVEENNDLEDGLEKAAFFYIWPWMSRHPMVVAALDFSALLVLFFLWRSVLYTRNPFLKREKKPSPGYKHPIFPFYPSRRP